MKIEELIGKKVFLTIVIFTYCFLFIFCTPDKSCHNTNTLEIRNIDNNKVLGKWQLDEYDEFTIEFIHSVNQSPVRETFQLVDGRIRLKSVRFYSLGVGMGDLTEGQELSRDGDAMIISGFNSSFKELNLITGSATNHALFIKNEIINLQKNTHIIILYR